ncbi:MAG: Rrf2 family transcriptional regulator [Candidatus Omnitrophica bacterium]|nr:Rrf2 family transcriptional regulator [Candidatus Omnitrophota bacterium]
MKVTYKGDYALKAVLDLALNYEKELVTSNQLASRIDAPIKFLEQVLLDLRKGGFVLSKRGNIGGYLLSRPPAKISVGDILRYIDGPLEPIACVKEGYSDCGDVKKCLFRNIWKKVAKAESDIVDNETFEDLVNEVNRDRQVLAYSI